MTSVPDMLRPEIERGIATHGQQLVGVAPAEDDPPGTPVYGYTIGNHAYGLPELLVLGMPCSGLGVLNILSTILRKQERAFRNGELVDLGGKLPIKVVEASPRAKSDYTIQAGQFWGTEDYRVQQVLVPDQQGRFPDEVGCAEPYASLQPRV